MNTPEELPKESIDKLLDIIFSGDPEVILSEDYHEGFKELMKYELITLIDGKVTLTELGIEAQSEGVSNVIEKLRLKPAAPVTPAVKIRSYRNRKMLISGLIFLTLLLFLLWGYLMAV